MSELERDAAVERLLKQAIAADAGATDACLDAEVLAAFVEGTLPAGVQRRVEVHAAGCARCQAVVAAVVRATPVVPAAAAPWWRRPVLRWAPAAAAATAAIVWLVVDRDLGRREPQVASAPQVQRFEPAPVTPSASSRTAPVAPPASAALPSASSERPRELPKQTAPPQLADRAARPEPERRASEESKPSAPLEKAEAQAQVAGVPPPAAAAAPPTSDARNAPLFRLQVGGAPILVTSPDDAVRWRVTGPGAVEKSTDRGATWSVRGLPGGNAQVTAGMAPSATVCWLVGRAGGVWRTIDGLAWEPVAFPDAVDLASVTASDAQSAVVTTADGRVFVTNDGGRTWAVK